VTQTQLFFTLLVTALLFINGTREIVANRNVWLGTLLIAIPVCGWVSIWVTP
jgi:hypothetical protein